MKIEALTLTTNDLVVLVLEYIRGLENIDPECTECISWEWVCDFDNLDGVHLRLTFPGLPI